MELDRSPTKLAKAEQSGDTSHMIAVCPCLSKSCTGYLAHPFAKLPPSPSPPIENMNRHTFLLGKNTYSSVKKNGSIFQF